MTPTLCDCGSCNVCAMPGTALPRPDDRTADALIAAADPHAKPARRPRVRVGGPADLVAAIQDPDQVDEAGGLGIGFALK